MQLVCKHNNHNILGCGEQTCQGRTSAQRPPKLLPALQFEHKGTKHVSFELNQLTTKQTLNTTYIQYTTIFPAEETAQTVFWMS